jgi:hypothetical protein
MKKKNIGDIHRIFCDSAMDAGVTDQQPGSPPKDAVLGVGSLMAYGIYSLTWGLQLFTTSSGKLSPSRISNLPSSNAFRLASD